MSCARLFEAEASRDGRLSGPERASFERHLPTCEECRAEVKALADLAERARAPEPVDELQVRRTGLAVIRAHDRELTAPPAPNRNWMLAAIPLGAILVWPLIAPSPPHAQVRPEPIASTPAVAFTPPPAPVDSEEPIATTPPAPVRAPDPAIEYRAAVAKLEAGDDRVAATMFERFALRHPTHENAEDAMYLRVVAFHHAGDDAATKAAAADYLAAHPNGFRAKEVAELAAP